jgi:hypothetical protein
MTNFCRSIGATVHETETDRLVGLQVTFAESRVCSLAKSADEVSAERTLDATELFKA